MYRISEKQKNPEDNLSMAFCAIVTGLYLTNLGHGIFPAGSIMPTVVSWVSKLLILVMLLPCIRTILARASNLMFLMFGVVLVVPLMQRLLFPDTWGYFSATYTTYLLTIFPGMICFAAIQDYNKCLRHLLATSAIISVINLLVVVFAGGSAFSTKYSMGYANALILPTNALIWHLVASKKSPWVRVVCAVLVAGNLLGVFVYGSRGALAVMMAFCVYLFFKVPISHKNSKAIKLGISLLALVLLIFYKPILTVLLDILESVGFESRTLSLLISDLGHDSGRAKLWASIWEDFTAAPFALRGINSDYVIINIYSHNVILELLHAFGLIFGCAVIAFLGCGVVQTMREKLNGYGVVRVLTCFSFFPMCFWSGSVWTSSYLWFWLIIWIRKDWRSQTRFIHRQPAVHLEQYFDKCMRFLRWSIEHLVGRKSDAT